MPAKEAHGQEQEVGVAEGQGACVAVGVAAVRAEEGADVAVVEIVLGSGFVAQDAFDGRAGDLRQVGGFGAGDGQVNDADALAGADMQGGESLDVVGACLHGGFLVMVG